MFPSPCVLPLQLLLLLLIMFETAMVLVIWVFNAFIVTKLALFDKAFLIDFHQNQKNYHAGVVPQSSSCVLGPRVGPFWVWSTTPRICTETNETPSCFLQVGVFPSPSSPTSSCLIVCGYVGAFPFSSHRTMCFITLLPPALSFRQVARACPSARSRTNCSISSPPQMATCQHLFARA